MRQEAVYTAAQPVSVLTGSTLNIRLPTEDALVPQQTEWLCPSKFLG